MIFLKSLPQPHVISSLLFLLQHSLTVLTPTMRLCTGTHASLPVQGTLIYTKSWKKNYEKTPTTLTEGPIFS